MKWRFVITALLLVTSVWPLALPTATTNVLLASTPPTVTTNNATSITPNSAVLNGTLTSLGTASSANVSFQWGLSSGNYTNTTPTVAMSATGTFNANLTGLSANTTYYFLAKAVGDGTSNGSERSITTTAVAGHPWSMFLHDPEHTGLSIYNGPNIPYVKWTYDSGVGISQSPAIGLDGTVYFGNKGFHALNPDGSLKWTYVNRCRQASPAIGVDGTIYCGEIGKLTALNRDGSLKWTYINDIWDSSPTIGPDGTIYFGSNDSSLYALNPNGSLRWIFPTQGSIGASPAIGKDGTVYVGNYSGEFFAVNLTLPP